MPEQAPETLVIIGSGPAAWTAATYAARARLEPVVYEGEPTRDMIPGGQLMWTTDIENYPGFPEGVGGQELMERMKEQAVRFGTRVVGESIASVDFSTRPFTLRPSWSEEIRAHAVIVATGARANWIGAEDEERLRATTPLRRTGSPDDVSRTVLFILESDYLTGETIIVDGGRHVRA